MGKKIHKRYKLIVNETIKTDTISQSQIIIEEDKMAQILAKAHFLYEDKLKKKKEEQHIENRIKAFNDMGIAKYFDDRGKPKKKNLFIDLYFVIRFIFAKEKNITLLISDSQDENSDYGILPFSVNVITSCLFLLIEWFLYILSILCCFKLLIPSFIFCIMNFEHIDYMICSIASFVISKTFIRLLKIDCKYNTDKNYMLNVLAIIVAVIAVIVSIIVR